MQEILLIDNFDSFTWNLVHYLEGDDCKVDVYRNNEIPFEKLGDYDRIVLSPGPGLPEQAGDLMKLFDTIAGKKPILGVCLGMQAISVYLGGGLMNKTRILHGVEDVVHQVGSSALFKDLPQEINVGLYHSWEVNDQGQYQIIARSKSDGTIMAISNEQLKLYGVQFHPESIMTPNGKEILRNFVNVID